MKKPDRKEQIGKATKIEGRLGVAKGWARGELGELEVCGFFWGEKNILELNTGDGCSALRIY